MKVDQKLRDASASVREARQHANFTVRAPGLLRDATGRRIAVVAAVVVLLVVGLPFIVLNGSGQHEDDAATARSTTIAPVTTTAPVMTTTPVEVEVTEAPGPQVDPSIGGPRNSAEHSQAMEIYVTDCMSAEGFDYVPRDQSDGLAPDVRSVSMLWSPPTNQQWAASDQELLTNGFGMFINIEESEAEGQMSAYTAAETQCGLSAWNAVPGPPAAIIERISDLELEVTDRIENDPRLAEARDGWSACMASSGFDVRSGDVFVYLRSFFLDTVGVSYSVANLTDLPEETLRTLQAHELALAEADVACQQDVRTVYVAIGVEHATDLLEKNPQIATYLGYGS